MSFKTSNLVLAFSSVPAHMWAGFSSHFLLLYSHHLPPSHRALGTLRTCHTTNSGKKFHCNSVLTQHQQWVPKHDWDVGGQMLVHKCLRTNNGSRGWIWFNGLLFFSTWKLYGSNISSVLCFFISTHFLPTICHIWLERQPFLQEDIMSILTSDRDNIKDKTAIKLLRDRNLLEHFHEIIKLGIISISDYEQQHISELIITILFLLVDSLWLIAVWREFKQINSKISHLKKGNMLYTYSVGTAKFLYFIWISLLYGRSLRE